MNHQPAPAIAMIIRDAAIREVLAATFALDPATITETTANRDIPDWDSLGQINLVLALEARFGVTIAPEHIAGLTSFARIREVLSEPGE